MSIHIHRRWAALAVIAAAQFMVIMDTSIIGVALPEIQTGLGFTPDSLSWVFNAYVIAFGGLLLLGGRLADLYGAKAVFTAGWLVLAGGSIVAGLADTPAVEIGGRAIQGAGAALIAPAALSLLMQIFGGNPTELVKAFAIYGAAAPAGGTAGVFLGGLLTEWASWPWVFYVNVPIAAIAIVASRALMPSTQPRRGSLDLLGALTATGGLGLLVYGIVSAPSEGWGSATTIISIAGGVGLLAAFVVAESRLREPLMRLSILRTPNLAAANGAQLLLGAAWVPMWFFLNLYLQQVLGFGPLESGLALLPMTTTIMLLMILIAPRAIARFGTKVPVVLGMFVLAGGLAMLALVRPNGSFWLDVLPASLIAATGMALAFIPSLSTAISSAPPEEGGLASGIVNTSYQFGSALGLAVVTALASGAGASALGDVEELTSGYSTAFLGAAVIAAIGAIVAKATLKRH